MTRRVNRNPVAADKSKGREAMLTTGEKLERALNFLMQLVDAMDKKFDNFESKVARAVTDELIDVLKDVKTEEMKKRVPPVHCAGCGSPHHRTEECPENPANRKRGR
jgi:hypothetical protein